MTEDDQRRAEIAGERLEEARAVEAYAASTLLPALGFAGRAFRLAPAGAGLRSLVYFLEVEASPKLAVRCVPRRGDARWLAAALDLFAAHSLPAPRQAHRDTSLGTWWRRGWAVFVEDFVEGKPVAAELPKEALLGLGRAYASVHSVTSPRWDRPHRLRGGDLIGGLCEWAERLAGEAAQAVRGGPASLGSRIAHLARRIRERRPAPPATYSLCHNRVTPTNVIVREDASCVLIDLERVKFGSHLHELALLRGEVLAGSEAAFDALLEGYRKAAPAILHPEADPGAWCWHRALVHLKRARDAARGGDLAHAGRELELAERTM